MADAPFSTTPFGRNTGAAVVLGDAAPAVRVLMQTEALQARRAAEKAKLVEQKNQEELKAFSAAVNNLNTATGLPYQTRHAAAAQELLRKIQEIYRDKTIPLQEKVMRGAQFRNEYETIGQLGKQIDERTHTLANSVDTTLYNRPKLITNLNNTLRREGELIPEGELDLQELDKQLLNPDNFNHGAVAKSFAETVYQKTKLTLAKAARPGQTGHETTYEMHGIELNADGSMKIDPQTGKPIVDAARVLDQARNNPQVNAIVEYNQQQHRAAIDAVVEKARNYQQLTPEERGLIDQEAKHPKGYVDFLADFLATQAYGRKIADKETYQAPLRSRAPKAAPKPAANQVTVTPTVGYQLSSFAPEPTGRFQQMKNKLGITPPITTNHYPTVGVTFGSAQRPYAEVTVDNHAAEIVGQEGKVTRKAQGNGKVPMQLVSRDYVLYVNGKRVGRSEAFGSDAEAYQHLLRTIDQLTPEQARKAELRAEYRGTLTDKTKTANDGGGGRPRATGRNETTGKPTYDTGVGEERLSVIVPANQATDAQLVQASGGKWDPRQATAEQTRAIEALTRKGGRLVNPYTSTSPKTPPAPAAKPGTGRFYQRPTPSAPAANPPAATPSGGKFYQRPTSR